MSKVQLKNLYIFIRIYDNIFQVRAVFLYHRNMMMAAGMLDKNKVLPIFYLTAIEMVQMKKFTHSLVVYYSRVLFYSCGIFSSFHALLSSSRITHKPDKPLIYVPNSSRRPVLKAYYRKLLSKIFDPISIIKGSF